jgi:hypothetical protein
MAVIAEIVIENDDASARAAVLQRLAESHEVVSSEVLPDVTLASVRL